MFFTALSFLPTRCCFCSQRPDQPQYRAVVQDGRQPRLEDTPAVANEYYVTASDLTLHYAVQLEKEMQPACSAERAGPWKPRPDQARRPRPLAEIAVAGGAVRLDPNLPWVRRRIGAPSGGPDRRALDDIEPVSRASHPQIVDLPPDTTLLTHGAVSAAELYPEDQQRQHQHYSRHDHQRY